MSRLATILLSLLAVAVVAGYVVWRFAPSSGQPRVGAGLFRFATDDIRGIEIANGDATVELRRTDGGWRMGPDPTDRASRDLIGKILQLAQETPVLDRIPARDLPDRDDLGEYGLRSSRMKLDFRGDGGRTLLFGKDAADDSRVYVRFEGSNDVFVIPDELANLVFRPAAEYRDPRLSNLRPDRVERFVIRQPAGEMEIRRDFSGWKIVKPMRAPADERAVAEFLARVLSLTAEGFGDSGDPADADGAISVQFFGEGDREPETLTLATNTTDGKVHARYTNRPGTFLLPESAKTLVAGNLDRFRDHAAVRINPDLVDKIIVTRAGRSIEFTRRGEDWVSGGTGGRAQEVERIFSALASAKLERFQPATEVALETAGVNPAQDSVRFLSVVSENTPETLAGEQAVATVAFGPAREDGTVAVHADGSAEFGWAPAALLDALPAAP